MICQYCLKNEATFHIQKILNNDLVEIHLCYDCSKKELNKDNENGIDDKVHRILEGLLDKNNKAKVDNNNIVCVKCGISLHDFETKGILGCPECYNTFKDTIIKNVKKSRVIYRKDKKLKETSKVDYLEIELKKAVEAEDFERAALIRDRIKQCKKRGNK